MAKESMADKRIEKEFGKIKLPQGSKPQNAKTRYVCTRDESGWEEFIPMAAASLERIVDIVLPSADLPEEVDFQVEDGQCLDLIALYVHSEFEADGFAYEIDYFLGTGAGGMRIIGDPVPDGWVDDVKILRQPL